MKRRFPSPARRDFSAPAQTPRGDNRPARRPPGRRDTDSAPAALVCTPDGSAPADVPLRIAVLGTGLALLLSAPRRSGQKWPFPLTARVTDLTGTPAEAGRASRPSSGTSRQERQSDAVLIVPTTQLKKLSNSAFASLKHGSSAQGVDDGQSCVASMIDACVSGRGRLGGRAAGRHLEPHYYRGR